VLKSDAMPGADGPYWCFEAGPLNKRAQSHLKPANNTLVVKTWEVRVPICRVP
jgi:hypothetical protein